MESTENRPQRKPLFKTSWLKSPTLKDWIEYIPDKPNKAYCKFCDRLLYAHRFSVVKHASTSKHQENAEKFRENSKTNQTELLTLEQNTKDSPESIKNNELSKENEFDNKYDEIIIAYTDDNNVEMLCSEKEEFNLIETDKECEDDEHFNSSIYEENTNEWIEYSEDVHPPNNQNNIVKMDTKNITISTHILDTSRGQPAANIPVTLFRLFNNEWKRISQTETNSDGRCPTLTSEDFIEGCYKLHFDVFTYFKETSSKFLYPFIEIVFQCEEGQHYHIPLLLNPFGYSTYRGS